MKVVNYNELQKKKVTMKAVYYFLDVLMRVRQFLLLCIY